MTSTPQEFQKQAGREKARAGAYYASAKEMYPAEFEEEELTPQKLPEKDILTVEKAKQWLPGPATFYIDTPAHRVRMKYVFKTGKDASRQLAKNRLDDDEDYPEDDGKPLTLAEEAALQAWVFSFKTKYDVVGNLEYAKD